MAMATFTPTKQQQDLIEAVEAKFGPEQRNTLVSLFLSAVAGSGKCLGEDTPVLLYDGRVRYAQDIEVGDLLMGPDSNPRQVLSTNVGYGPLYEITPVKGIPWVCNDVHVMTLMGTNRFRGQIIDIPLNEFISGVLPNTRPNREGRVDHQWKLFRVGVEFEDKPVEIEPYLAGLWLGDGTTASVEFTNQDEAVINYLIEIAPKYGAHAYITANNGSDHVKRIALRMGRRGQAGCHTPSILRRTLLKKFRNVSGEKDIPQEYLINSRQKRLELLAGIIDTDGHYSAKGKYYEIATKHSHLAGHIVFLAQSLGFAANCTQKPIVIERSGETRIYYRITICGDTYEIPCRIPYKQATPREQIKDVLVTGWSAEPIGNGHYYGFTLDGDGRFLLGDFTVTHNTSSLMLVAETLKDMPETANLKGCMVAFNKIIATTLQNKLKAIGSRLEAKTTNALGHAILSQAASTSLCPKPKLETKKYYERVLNYVNARKFSFSAGKIPPKLISSINKLVSAARLTFTEPTEENLLDIVDHYGLEIDTKVHWSFIWQAVKPIIEEGVNEFLATGAIDFDDQIYLPIRLEYAAPIYDVLMVDEAQDLNSVRLKLIQSCVKSDGLLLFVGDAFQAIQGFAFADTHSVQTIKQQTSAIELPLSVCWRCDNKIIEVAQQIVPHIQARPGAKDGTVEVIPSSVVVKYLETGYKRGNDTKDADLVLCRVNAELISYCLDTIRAGKYAVIRGRSIGRGILAKIDEIIASANKPVTIANLSEVAGEWLAQQVNALWGKKNAEDKIAKLEDQVESIDAFLTGFLIDQPTGNLDQLRVYIEEKFSGDEGENEENDGIQPIIFSTVHKAKGLEFDRVFILRSDLMPHPMAKLDWQVEQEYNILYVACTRAKHELYFVDAAPACVAHVVNPEEEISEQEAIAVAESIVTPVIDPVIVEETTLPIEPVTVVEEVVANVPETGTVEKPAVNYPYSDGKSRKSAAKTKGVAYNFPPELCDKLDLATKLILEKDGHKFDKSAYIAGVLVGQYPNIDELLAQLQDQGCCPDPDNNGGGTPKPEKSQQDKSTSAHPIIETLKHSLQEQSQNSVLASFFDQAIQDAASRGYIVQAVVPTPQTTMPIVATEGHVETPMLFDAPVDPEKAYRRFYHCGSKFCKHKWGCDYRYDNTLNEFYRLDANGNRISAEQDAICPKCGNDGKYTKKRTLKATYNDGHKCTASCKNATSDECICMCGGSLHGSKHLLGVPLLKAPKK